MQQNSKQLDGHVTCLLVQTINGQQEMRLVAIQQEHIEQFKQPLVEQQQSEADPLLQNSQMHQQQYTQQQQQQLYQQQLAQQQLTQQQQQQQLLQQQQIQQYQQYQQQQSSNIEYRQSDQQQQRIQDIQKHEQQIQINQAQQELAEIAKEIDPNFNETDYHSRLVTIYNKLCCFVTFYILVNVACLVIQYVLHGSISAAGFWIASGSVLIVSMGCSCCGVRYSRCWLLTIHMLFLTVFFALEIVAFIRAIQHPILDEYVRDGDLVYNARLLTSITQNYDDCKTLRDSYPDYYQEIKSECEFEIMLGDNPSHGEEVKKTTKTYYHHYVSVTEYTTVLQKAITAVYSFGLLLAIIIYFYFVKEFINFYRYNKQINLHKRQQELQRIGN